MADTPVQTTEKAFIRAKAALPPPFQKHAQRTTCASSISVALCLPWLTLAHSGSPPWLTHCQQFDECQTSKLNVNTLLTSLQPPLKARLLLSIEHGRQAANSRMQQNLKILRDYSTMRDIIHVMRTNGLIAALSDPKCAKGPTSFDSVRISIQFGLLNSSFL